jgi:hypothetical protein
MGISFDELPRDLPEDSEEAQWLKNFERMWPGIERAERKFVERLKRHCVAEAYGGERCIGKCMMPRDC